MAERPKSDITLYTAPTPNGIKISILLEELGLPYKTHRINLTANEQKQPWFLALNPNGRVPALTDILDDGSPVRLFESGSIMQYLISRYDTPTHTVSYPPDTRAHYETTSWLFFQNAGVGPMQGQANHFARYAPQRIEYGVARYANETRRLYRVLDTHLREAGSAYLVGERCTVADIANWAWVSGAAWAGVEMEEFPTLRAWEARMEAREGVRRGRDVPVPHDLKATARDPETAERVARESAAWVQAGMREDAKRGGEER